jgi:hypothetical protein
MPEDHDPHRHSGVVKHNRAAKRFVEAAVAEMGLGSRMVWFKGLLSIQAMLLQRPRSTIPSPEIATSLAEFEMDDGDKIIQQINLEYSAVNSKASSLLTHVSMMIAALSFIFGIGRDAPFKALGLLNLLLYFVPLLIILRVIWVPDFHESQVEQRRFLLARELLQSQRRLRLAHRIVVGLTVLVVFVLVADRITAAWGILALSSAPPFQHATLDARNPPTAPREPSQGAELT